MGVLKVKDTVVRIEARAAKTAKVTDAELIDGEVVYRVEYDEGGFGYWAASALEITVGGKTETLDKYVKPGEDWTVKASKETLL